MEEPREQDQGLLPVRRAGEPIRLGALTPSLEGDAHVYYHGKVRGGRVR
jgi:hypothetical protein